jgi:hypothetical protein
MALVRRTFTAAANTPIRLTDTTSVVARTLIKALSTNAQAVYIGYEDPAEVTTAKAWELRPGEEMIVYSEEVRNPSLIFLVAGAANVGVCYRIG